MKLLTRRRWWVAMALAIGAGLLQSIPEFHELESLDSIGLRFALWVIETPLQVVALSLTFDRCVQQKLNAASMVVVSLLVAMAVGALCGVAFVYVFQDLLGIALDEKGPLPLSLVAGFGAASGVFKAGTWGVAFVSPHVSERAQARELEAERLRIEADRLRIEAEQLRTSSELARLRAQLEPHFLLNTLNTIAALVTQEPREARRLLGCLGDLLRDALEGQDEMQTLHHEVTWLRRYAEILESRHGDAIRFDWDIPADAAGVLLPKLLLQPLVENAVQHGALCRAGGGRVAVHATLKTSADGASTLVCTVMDNGPGIAAAEPRAGALGLHAVRRRLELRCPGSAFRLQSSSEGTSAIVEVRVAPVVAA